MAKGEDENRRGRAGRQEIIFTVRSGISGLDFSGTIATHGGFMKAGWYGFGLDPRIWTVFVIAAALVVALGFSLAWRRGRRPWSWSGLSGES